MALLHIENLTVEFGKEKNPFRAVDNVSLQIEKGEVLGIVGESGSGKSVTAKAVMGLIDWPGRVRAENLEFDGQDLQTMPDKQRRKITGREVAMIFQDLDIHKYVFTPKKSLSLVGQIFFLAM